MARKLEHNYTFTPSTNTIVLNYIYKPERILLIVNVTDNVTIFQFNDPQSGFSNVSYNYTLETTTIVVNYDCSAMSSTDKIQVWVENDAVTFEPSETFVDPVSKIRVSTPENLIDTDFEYGLQSQKWETLEQVKNIPTFFSRSGDESIELTAMTTAAGTDVVTVTTANDHSYARGIPIIVIGSKSASCDGAFVVTNVLSATVFQYKAKNTQATTGSILDTYTQLFTGSVYQGTEFDLSGISAITTDEEENSTLTVTTTFPTNFTPGTEFYLSNSLSSVSQSFDAAQIQGADSETTSFAIDTTSQVAYDDYFLTSTYDFRRWIPLDAFYFNMSDIDDINTTTDIITFSIEHGMSDGVYYLDLGIGNGNRITGIRGDAYYYVHVHSPTSISLHSSTGGALNGVSNRYDISLNTDTSLDGGRTRCFFHRSYLWQSWSGDILQSLYTGFGDSLQYFQDKHNTAGSVTFLGGLTATDRPHLYSSTTRGSDSESLQYESRFSQQWRTSSLRGSTGFFMANLYNSGSGTAFTREIIANPNWGTFYQPDHGLETNDGVNISITSPQLVYSWDFEDESWQQDWSVPASTVNTFPIGSGISVSGGFVSSDRPGFDNTVYDIALQSDGKILVGGRFTSLNGNVGRRLVRLNSDGTVDTAFYTNLGTAFNNDVYAIALQSDGKIVVGGLFTTLNGVTRRSLVRLNADGTEDTAFYTNLGTGFNNFVYDISVQSDGKILVGGSFTALNGTSRNRLVRLNSNGTVDTAFYTNLGTGFNNGVYTIALQSDGKILVGGLFTTFNGNTRNYLVRLDSDGTEDTAFYTNLGTGFTSTVYAITEQSDGKILVGGLFTSLNGTTRNRLVRLNADGTVDTAFYTNLGTGFNSDAYTVRIQSDGKILVGGGFSSFNGNTRNRLVRLNSDGTEDTAFYTNLGTGFSSSVLEIAVQSDGKICLGGAFTALNGTSRNRLVRLNTDGTEDQLGTSTRHLQWGGNDSQSSEGYVISKQFFSMDRPSYWNASQNQQIVISFDLIGGNFSNGGDYGGADNLYLQISTNGGNSWFVDSEYFYGSNYVNWTRIRRTLRSNNYPNGDDVSFAIRFYSQADSRTTPQWAIDNLSVSFFDVVADDDSVNTVEKISNDRFRLKLPGSGIYTITNHIYGPTYTFTRIRDNTDTDSIVAPGHTLSENSEVTYDRNGNTEISGLTDGNDYYVYQATEQAFKLSSQSGGLVGSPVTYSLYFPSNSNFYTTVDKLSLFPTSLSTLISAGWSNGDRVIYQANSNASLIPGLISGAFYFVNLFSLSGYAQARLYRDQADAIAGNANYIRIKWNGANFGTNQGSIQRTGLVDIETAVGTHKLVATQAGAADAVYSLDSVVDDTTFTLSTRSTISSRPFALNDTTINSKDHAVYVQGHGLVTGTTVTLDTTGTAPGELNDGSSVAFFVIRQSKDWFRLAPTAEDVETNNYLLLTDLGTGTSSLSTTSVSGETATAGTVAIADGSAVVTGTGTNFSAQFNVGDVIKIYTPEVAVAKSPTATSTGSDYFTLNGHGMSDGDVLRVLATGRADITEGQLVYARSTGTGDPTNRFSIHPTYDDAVNGTNIIDITDSGTGDLFENITSIGSTIEADIVYINSQTLLTVSENLTTTASGLFYAANTSLLVRANGFALHRPYDGGVELIPAENPDGQMIRQTRRYFRYQSGKGIQVSMAINFSPSVQIEEMLRIDTDSTASASITTRNPHRLTAGLNVTVSGAQVTSGDNYWNGDFEVDSIIDDRTFTVNLAGNPVDGFAQGLAEFVVESWTGGVTKAGLFDDQNGLFFEYDGQQLYAVRRSSTTQISGSADVQFGSGAISGTNTKFTSQLAVDDYVVIKGQTYIITKIASDQLLYVMPSYRGETNTACIITKVIDTKIPQSAWNLDHCDGTGPTGYFLDIHKIQMAYIDYSWYGAGKARFGFKDQKGRVIYCHEFIHNNKNTEAYMRSGNLPARYEIENVGTPSYVPSLAHWGTSVIMDGGFDDDKAYVFTANSNNISVTGEATVTVSARVENTGTFRIFDGRIFQSAGFALTIATPSPVFASISQGFAISGSNIPAGTRVRNPQSTNLSQTPYQPDVLSGIGGTIFAPTNIASRSLLIIDRQPTGTSLSNSNYTVTVGGTTSVVYDQPLISIRLAPSVDTGTPGPLGAREIINRMQLILNSVGILTTHSVEISLKLNGRLNTNAWSRVTNPSLSQLIYHQTGDTITGGATIYSFRAQGTTATAGRTQAQTTEQLDEIATLGNSILGGDATFPDGPDVLTVVARLVEDPSTVSGSNPFNINGRISWSESQA